MRRRRQRCEEGVVSYLHQLGIHDPAVRQHFDVRQSLRALAASSTCRAISNFSFSRLDFCILNSAAALKVIVVVSLGYRRPAFWQGDIVQAKYARWNNDGNLKMGEVKTDGTRGLLLSSPRHEWPA